MTSDDYISGELCTLAWRLGRKHGVNGMCAIMMVARNRVTAGQESGNWTAVISGMLDGSTELPDPRDPEFQKILQLVDGIYLGTTPDNLTDGALWYSDKALGNNYERCAVVGTLVFYK